MAQICRWPSEFMAIVNGGTPQDVMLEASAVMRRHNCEMPEGLAQEFMRAIRIGIGRLDKVKQREARLLVYSVIANGEGIAAVEASDIMSRISAGPKEKSQWRAQTLRKQSHLNSRQSRQLT